ncbi:hypothetical protein SAY87_014650 [Trapa incisa]|uniref:DNA-3-methyladenine glycosylase I n=1 Tax=Trapa incisa TaxID=236973 RepID=A0AAN7H058_9MYRT|nr:hypothetical protein SAY87_014650 [Trapa incisa]
MLKAGKWNNIYQHGCNSHLIGEREKRKEDSTDPSSDCVSVRMCSSKPKLHQQHRVALAHINGRPVLHHTCNQINSCPDHSRNPPHPPPPLPSKSSLTRVSTSPPISPKIRSLRSPPNGLSSSSVDKVTKTKGSSPSSGVTMRKSMSRALSFQETRSIDAAAIGAGSIAAARKEQVAMQQEQRKMKIAHYGRVKSAKFESRVVPLNPSPPATTTAVAASTNRDEKRCTFVTSNSDPVFVAYHDEEWGVPVHDDRLLFELLVLTGAQVGSDWSSVLKKRQIFREAFAGFDADAVAKFTEKKITSLSAAYGIDQSLIRAAVDNSRRILEIAKEFGTFSEYLWGFVNKKPIVTQYKRCQKIPVKTSKSETISKDMVKRGFRSVGPTVIYSFMQAAGLTNDHLITCPRHLQCSSLSAAPAPAY